MKQRIFIFVLVIFLACLAAVPAPAQTGKNGPMAKLTNSLVKLHNQYVPIWHNVAPHHLAQATL